MMVARRLCLFALVALAASAAGGDQPRTTADLDEILDRLGAVADLYVRQAVEFSCVEVIRWSTYDSDGRIVARQGQHRSNYLFRRSGGDDIEELRAPKRARSLDRIQGHVERSRVPLYVERAYFWIVLFHAGHRDRYAYSIEEEAVHAGRPAVRIRFEPVPPIEEGINEWYGTAVVDLETYQLLAAEGITDSSHRAIQHLEQLSSSPEPLPADIDYRTVIVVRVATEFEIEKRSVRFPSKVTVEKSRHRVRGEAGERETRRIPMHKVEQIYKDYRFYDVDLWDDVGTDEELSVEAVPVRCEN